MSKLCSVETRQILLLPKIELYIWLKKCFIKIIHYIAIV